ncbi:MAG: GspH/FimT family pseudopilin [Nitrospirota bacterium]|nr:GspH/FimT family pseudopilin [Nitrospirota bacterium]
MTQKGFTLIELVMIIVLIGIVALFVAPRLPSITATRGGAFTDKLKADIRYAQTLAMTENRRYRVFVNTAPGPNPGYAVMNDANGNTVWGDPGEVARDPAGSGNLSVVLDAGEYAGITVAPAVTLEFDSFGRPTLGGGTILTISPAGTTVTVTDRTGAVN